MHNFLAALAPEPFRVLGQDLRQLSFGHVVLMHRIGIDVVDSVEDLFAAVQICSRSFADGLQYIQALATPIGYANLEAQAEEAQALDMERAFSAWGEYLQEHTQKPEYCAVDGPKSERGAPFLAQLRHVLLSSCNYSPEYLMDAPYGQCLWDYGCAIEDANGWGIVGDQHRAVADLLKEGRN